MSPVTTICLPDFKGIKYFLALFLFTLGCYTNLFSKDIHVSKAGNDNNTGTISAPFLTISKAASVAISGDYIIIHAGTYREYIDPPRGGTSPASRITYQSADNEEVFVKGSEVINTWVSNGNGLWEVTLPSSFFNGYNPYLLRVNGDFQNYGQWHHRGDVYINNGVMSELQTLDQVEEETYTWYTKTENDQTTIYGNFGTLDPNNELTEINVRELIFFSSGIDIDYITLNGLRFLHAAPNWQAPNEGSNDPNRLTQKGAVGSNMGKGWIIENCEVSYSKTAGIMMGESADRQNTFEDINAFGGHIIRNNIITKCGEYGIAGQKGMTRSTIEGNRIEDINFRNEFGGFEPAGIKIWNCVDVLIQDNLVRNVIATQREDSQSYCIWIDFANQGTRITRNFLIGSPMTTTTLFLEANIGPTLVDNNVFLESVNKPIFIFSGGSILAHNLFINSGFNFAIQEFGNGGSGARNAYTYQPNTLIQTNNGQKVEIEYNQLYNNIFARGAGPINFSTNSGKGNVVDHNIYIGGTTSAAAHTHATKSNFVFAYNLEDKEDGVDFSFEFDNSFLNTAPPFLNPEVIGIIPFANQSILDKNGNPITVDTDFNLSARTNTHPTPGPLENLNEGTNKLSITTAMLPTPGIKYPVPISRPPQINQAPFFGTPTLLPGTIEAENYDFGGQSVSFNDDNSKEGNTSLRAEDNVDLGEGGANGTVVGWFEAGEWLEYTVNIPNGDYSIDVSASSALVAPGELEIILDGISLTSINIGSTSSWDNYKTFSSQNISISARENAIIRILSSGGFNIDKLVFRSNLVQSLGSNIALPEIVKTYPNPVTTELIIETPWNFTPLLKVYGLTGDLLVTKSASILDLSPLSAGTYILTINDMVVRRFVKTE